MNCDDTIDGLRGGAVSGDSSFDRIGAGTSTPTESLHVLQGNVRFQGAGNQVFLERNSDNIAAHSLAFVKTRGSPTAPTPTLDSDLLGTLEWLGYDGADFQLGAYIQAGVDGAPGLGKFPTALRFVTASADPGDTAERMRITSAGYVGVGTSAPSYKLTVADGDICITAPGNGLILKSPDGTRCRRLGIDNAGNVTLTVVGMCD